MKIVGVTHARQDLLRGTIETHPSNEILSILQSLNESACIGIECLPHNSSFLKKSEEMGFRNEGGEYFNLIQKICLNKGLKIIYLENEELELERISKLAEFYETKKFAKYVDFLDVFINKRDTYSLEKIKSEKPNVSFVGLGHANKWMKENSIEGEYIFEVLDTTNTVNHKTPFVSEELYEFNSSLNKLISLYRTGRMTEKLPDVVGSWQIPNMFGDICDLSGYFEVFKTSENSGIISDFLGEAIYYGCIDGQDIRFTKKYISCLPTTFRIPIVYSGKYDSQRECKGEYELPKYYKKFIMKKELPKEIFSDNQFSLLVESLEDIMGQHWNYEKELARKTN